MKASNMPTLCFFFPPCTASRLFVMLFVCSCSVVSFREGLFLLQLHGQTRRWGYSKFFFFFEENHLNCPKHSSVFWWCSKHVGQRVSGLLASWKRDESQSSMMHHPSGVIDGVTKLRNEDLVIVMQWVLHVVNHIVLRTLNHRRVQAAG